MKETETERERRRETGISPINRGEEGVNLEIKRGRNKEGVEEQCLY